LSGVGINYLLKPEGAGIIFQENEETHTSSGVVIENGPVYREKAKRK